MLSNEVSALQLPVTDQPVNLLDGFWLDGYWILPNTGEIVHEQTVSRLEPKVMDVLVVLAKNVGTVVSAEALFDAVWPNAIFSPISIRRAINQIRNAIGDIEKQTLKTHPKRGYALYASIQVEQLDKCAETMHGDNNTHAAAQNPFSDAQTRRLSPRNFSTQNLKQVITYFSLVIVIIGFYFLFPVQPIHMVEAHPPLKVSNFQPVTATNDNEYLSLFTPNNDGLIYLKEGSANAQGTEVWFMSLDKSSSRRLWQSDEHIQTMAWRYNDPEAPPQLVLASPQGEQLRIDSITFDSQYRLQTHQHHMTLAGRLGISSLVVVNDHVVLVLKHNEKVSVYQGDLHSGQITELDKATEDFLPYRITTASEQNEVTLVGFDSKRRTQLRVLNLTDGQTAERATLDENWYFVHYAPKLAGYLLSDGKRLLSLDSTNNLNHIPFEFYDFLHHPTLSPNAKQLSFTLAQISGSLFKYDFATNEVTPLTKSNRHDWQGSLSPSGKFLAFISNRNGYSQVFVKSLDSGEVRLVYRNPDQHLALSKPIWSHDESTLAFARNERMTLLKWRPDTPLVQEYNTTVGVPTQWHHETSILLRRKGPNGNTWLDWQFDSQKERVLFQGGTQLVLIGSTIWQIDPSIVRDASGELMFQTEPNHHIVAHRKVKTGLELIVSTARKDTYQRVRLDANGEVEQLNEFLLPAGEIADFNQDSMVFTVEQFQKDIVMLEVK